MVAPTVLAVIGGSAYLLRKQQIARNAQRSYNEGQTALAAGDYKTAMPLIATYVGQHQTDAEALLKLADCRANVKKPEGTEIVEAARYAEAALTADPKNVRAMEMLVGYYSTIGFVTELNRVSDQLLAVNKDHPKALKAQAQALLSLSKYKEAAKSAESLAALDPANADAFRLLLEIHKRQGDTDEKLAAEAKALADRFPESFDLAVIRMQMLAQTGDLAATAAQINRASSLKPNSVRGLADFLRTTDLVAIRTRIGKPNSPDTETKLFRAAARAAAESALANPKIAVKCAAITAAWEWRGGRLPEALGWIEKAEKIAPLDPDVLGWKAMIARDQSQPWQTQVESLKAIKTDPATLWTELLDGIALIDRSSWTAAADRLRSVSKDTKHTLSSPVSDNAAAEDARTSAAEISILSTYFLANAESGQGDWRIAVRYWLAIADAEPAWTLPILNASRTLIDRGQIDAGLTQAYRALTARPGSVEGITFARAAIAQAESGNPSDPELLKKISPLLDELTANAGLRSETLELRTRLAILQKNPEQVKTAVAAVLAQNPPAKPAQLLALAQRVRTAGFDTWQQLRDAAGDGPQTISFQADELVAAGKPADALSLLRKAAEGRTGADVVPLKFHEAQILASTGDQAKALEVLDTLSSENATNAIVQTDLLQQPTVWTDAKLVGLVIERLHSVTGDNGVEWQLADANRQLTFSPVESKAQDNILRLNRIIRDDPKNAQALSILSEWMLVVKDETGAISNLARAVDIPDAPPSLYPRLIGLLRSAGRQDEAKSRLQKFAKLNNLSPELLRTRAILLVDLGMSDLALLDYQNAASGGTLNDQIAYAAALAALQGKTAEAVDLLEKVVSQPGLTSDQFARAAGILTGAGKADRAIELLQQRKDPPATTATLRGRILEGAKRLPEAEIAFTEATKAAGADSVAFVELGRFYLRQAQPTKTRETVQAARALGLKSGELDSIDALADAAGGKNLNNQQQDAVIAALPLGPQKDLAKACQEYDADPTRKTEFIKKLRAILATDQRLLVAWQFLVRTLVESGEIDQAISAARSAAIALPKDIAAARLETNMLGQAGKNVDATTAAKRWLSLGGDQLEPSIVLAKLEIIEGHPDRARAILDPLTRNRTDSRGSTVDVWTSLVSSYARLGDISRARQLAAMQDPAWKFWPESIAAIAAADASPAAAAREWLDSLRPALTATPQGSLRLAEAFTTLGFRGNDRNDFQAALTLLEPLLASAEAKAGQFILAATLLEQLDRNSDAEAMYRRALDKDKDQWIAANNLAYILVRRTPPPPETLPLAQRANELASRSNAAPAQRSSVLQTLALALLKSGQATDALQTIRKALTLDNSSAEARLTEAEALEATGDKQGARASVQAILTQSENGGKLTLKDEDRARVKALSDRLGK